MSLHILRTPTEEIRRWLVGEKWCFGCRKRLPHEWVVHAPLDPYSYYGPHGQYQCSVCKKDRTRFPGTGRK